MLNRCTHLLLPYEPAQFHYEFLCSNLRPDLWAAYAASIDRADDWSKNRSYMTFTLSSSALGQSSGLSICSVGEVSGIIGTVLPEYLTQLHQILSCLTSYRIDLYDMDDINNSEIRLVLSWNSL